MTHAAPKSPLGRFYHLLHSGPGIIASALLGLYVGVNWPLNTLPEQFQELYTALYRMMALPFLVLTIIYAITRLRARDDDSLPGRKIMVLMASAMVLTASLAIAVSWAICSYESETVTQGIGTLVAAFEKSDADFTEVSLSATEGAAHSSVLLDAVADLLPSNVFSALSVMNLGQIIIFLIVFSVAVLKVPHARRAKFKLVVGSLRRPFEHMIEKMQFLVPIAVFFYAVHASHVVSAQDMSALKLLFAVIAASSLITCFGAIILVSVLSRRSPLRVAGDMRDAVLAGILAVTEEASLAMILRRIRVSGSGDEDDQEVIASLGLAIRRFGMITLLASVMTVRELDRQHYGRHPVHRPHTWMHCAKGLVDVQEDVQKDVGQHQSYDAAVKKQRQAIVGVMAMQNSVQALRQRGAPNRRRKCSMTPAKFGKIAPKIHELRHSNIP